MIAANFFRAFAALFSMLSPMASPVAEPASGDTVAIDFGSWTFSLPQDWALDKKHEPGVPFFESADRSKGCYVKLITRKTSGSTADFAADIQRVHRETLESLPGRSWRIMSNESSSTADAATLATLDMFDSEHSYRVLSKVIANRDAAVQLTLHDYDCKDYAASLQSFASIADSLRPRSR